jgi:hypothetical protein
LFFASKVIASVCGMLISFCPGNPRSWFVDMEDHDDDAALEWMFDGLSNVAAAVGSCVHVCNTIRRMGLTDVRSFTTKNQQKR